MGSSPHAPPFPPSNGPDRPHKPPPKPRPTGPSIRPLTKRERLDRADRIKAQVDEMQGKVVTK